MRQIFLFLVIVFSACKQTDQSSVINSQVSPDGWEAVAFYDSTGNVVLYNLLKPLSVDDDQLYPLVLFLHGAGERGNDNKAQLVHIAPIFKSDSIREKYPSFVVFPQCPKDEFWAAMEEIDGEWKPVSSGPVDPSLGRVMGVVDNMIDSYPIDTNRIYISGLSMGGFGTFDYLAREPKKFAAAIPICGGGDTAFAKNYAHVPMKIFHGADDQVVSPQLSRDVHQALLQAGAKEVEYVEFPGVGHDAWTPAYQYEGLLDWMYSQSKMK
ncbi:MAG: prolyl oligopeptidase family serine peptidase [Saprospiraceae bacterium]|nr:prolyl oligopeptidase family serine peptidase [Saprospiraceae bacterium]